MNGQVPVVYNVFITLANVVSAAFRKKKEASYDFPVCKNNC